MGIETREGEIYVFCSERGEWELIGRMEDVNDAAEVARFFQRRDGGEYQYAYVDRYGDLIEI